MAEDETKNCQQAILVTRNVAFMLLGLNLLCGQTAALSYILQGGIRF